MLNGLDLFTGIGGITRALEGFVRPIAYCEIDPYCQSVLLQKMQEGHLPRAPIWDDVRKLSRDVLFDSGIIFYPIDIIYGGFPCQDISVAGNQKGLEGERSSLFFEISRLIDEIKPSFVFLENVPNIRTKGAERVCKELAERGYDSRWCCVSASDVGAPHKRERWFLLAHPIGSRCKAEQFAFTLEKGNHTAWLCGSYVPNSGCVNERSEKESERASDYVTRFAGHWEVEPAVGRVADGIPYRVDRIKALGNSVVPPQVNKAFKTLLGINDS